jgi:hypothetical protein
MVTRTKRPDGFYRLENDTIPGGFILLSPTDVKEIAEEYELFNIIQDIELVAGKSKFTDSELLDIAKQIAAEETECAMSDDRYIQSVIDITKTFKAQKEYKTERNDNNG